MRVDAAYGGTVVMALALGACAELRPEPTMRLGDREIQEVKDTVVVVGGAEQDTLLFTPMLVEFVADGIAVWDRDRSQVLFFSLEGEPRWRFGGSGSGPGEFSGVTQIAADDRDQLWILDPQNARVTLLGTEGLPIREFQLPDVGYLDRLVPIGDGRALLLGMEPMVHTVDERGNYLGSKPHPYPEYGTLHPISAYNRAVHDWASDSTAFFFYYGGGFVGTDSALTASTLRAYVEDIPFPEVTVERTEGADGRVTTSSQVNASRLAAKGGAADDGVLHLLYQGDTEYAHRLVDRYAVGSGEYLGSWLLPDSTRAIAVRGDLVAMLVETPYPALVVSRTPGR